ncbi:MAG: hypothetical protein WBP45_04145 [Daejeonella sp.]
MLQQNIQNLYQVFFGYKLNRRITGCYCNVCLSEEYNHYLHQKKLSELNDEDFEVYLSSCDILDGNQNDFKYFLPRMLELCVMSSGSDRIHERIAESNYKNWPIIEIEAINIFFQSFWYDQLKTKNADAIIFLLYDLADAEYNVEFCLKNLSAFNPDDLAEFLIILSDNGHLKKLNKYDFNPPNEYRVKIKDWALSAKNRELLANYFKSGKDAYGRTSFVPDI